MTLSPGTRLGPYEGMVAIGAGGMGEVFRAGDTTPNRDVAIKVLPAAMAGDPERLARFKGEGPQLVRGGEAPDRGGAHPVVGFSLSHHRITTAMGVSPGARPGALP